MTSRQLYVIDFLRLFITQNVQSWNVRLLLFKIEFRENWVENQSTGCQTVKVSWFKLLASVITATCRSRSVCSQEKQSGGHWIDENPREPAKFEANRFLARLLSQYRCVTAVSLPTVLNVVYDFAGSRESENKLTEDKFWTRSRAHSAFSRGFCHWTRSTSGLCVQRFSMLSINH